jgi:hypothetical protein
VILDTVLVIGFYSLFLMLDAVLTLKLTNTKGLSGYLKSMIWAVCFVYLVETPFNYYGYYSRHTASGSAYSLALAVMIISSLAALGLLAARQLPKAEFVKFVRENLILRQADLKYFLLVLVPMPANSELAGLSGIFGLIRIPAFFRYA